MIKLSDEHVAVVNRERKTVVNYDSICILPPFTSEGVEMKELVEYAFSVFDSCKHNISSVFWCFGGGNIAPYPSKVLPTFTYPKYKKWFAEGVDIVRVFIDETKKRGLEAFLSFRMNEIDFDWWYNRLLPNFKDHPDWVMPVWDSSRFGEGTVNSFRWNYAVKEMRDFRLNCLRELALNYDLEGLELDFCRSNPYFPVDEQWLHRDEMTDFVRNVRLMLLEIEEKRKRPFLLAARVPENVDGAKIDGFDLETWAREQLVDMFVLGSRTIDGDLEGFRRISEGTHIKLYSCIEPHHCSDGYGNLPIEIYRGITINWFSRGADGIQTFNFSNVTKEARLKLKPEQLPPLYQFHEDGWGWDLQEKFYEELADLESIKYKDKTFVVERKGGGGHGVGVPPPEDWHTPKFGYDLSNMFAQLPATIANSGKIDTFTTLYVGDDVNAEKEKINSINLRILLSDPTNVFESQMLSWTNVPSEKFLEPALVKPKRAKNGPRYNVPPNKGIEKQVEARINGVLLEQAVIDKGWLAFKVKPEQLAYGRNLISVRVKNRVADSSDKKIIIEKVELNVKYKNIKQKLVKTSH